MPIKKLVETNLAICEEKEGRRTKDLEPKSSSKSTRLFSINTAIVIIILVFAAFVGR